MTICTPKMGFKVRMLTLYRNTADFLTSITDRIETQVPARFVDRVPHTPDELVTTLRNSPNYARLLEEISNYNKNSPQPGTPTLPTSRNPSNQYSDPAHLSRE